MGSKVLEGAKGEMEDPKGKFIVSLFCLRQFQIGGS